MRQRRCRHVKNSVKEPEPTKAREKHGQHFCVCVDDGRNEHGTKEEISPAHDSGQRFITVVGHRQCSVWVRFEPNAIAQQNDCGRETYDPYQRHDLDLDSRTTGGDDADGSVGLVANGAALGLKLTRSSRKVGAA